MPSDRRISFDVPEHLFLKLNKLVPHGVKSYLLRLLVETLVLSMERDREGFLLNLYRHKLNALDILEEELKKGGKTERPQTEHLGTPTS